MTPPTDPLIFHITHVENLAGILREGGLWSDAQRIARKLVTANIGYTHIKNRRLSRPVPTTGGGMLGEYVPFNFCERSVMLLAVHGGHKDYSGGQEGIVHLVSCVSRAIAVGRPWAFTDRHAELAHALYYEDLRRLTEVRWDVMPLKWWSAVKEERQAEFLVRDFFPWACVTEIVCATDATAQRAAQLLVGAGYQPPVVVRPGWYY
jgi:hypothetical protein